MSNASTARQPRGIVFVNGVRVAWLEIEANSNGGYQADSFRVVVPVSKNQPKEINRAWWAAQNPITVEIYAGFPSNVDAYSKANLDLLIEGLVDEVPDDLIAETIVLSGRDYTSLMIETKIVAGEKLNRTASDVAIEFATKYNLTTDNIVQTNTKIGRIYELSYTKMNHQVTEWDLLSFLAQEEGFQVFVKGRDLHFEPKPDTAPIYLIEWKDEDESGLKQFRGERLTFTRNLTLAKDIIVYVRVINIKTGKPFTVKVQASHTRDKVLNKGRHSIGRPQVYFEHKKAHMDKAGALRYANKLLRDISRHQIKMNASGIPADNELTPQHMIKVIGTTVYDQMYHPDSIVRRLSMKDGYVMDVIGKNHDVNSEVPV